MNETLLDLRRRSVEELNESRQGKTKKVPSDHTVQSQVSSGNTHTFIPSEVMNKE